MTLLGEKAICYKTTKGRNKLFVAKHQKHDTLASIIWWV
jgi:hypothetical protein